MSSGVDEVAPAEPGTGFAVRLDNFEGPFDLLLQLISKHKLDITEVSLSKVTDEFIAHVKAISRAEGEQAARGGVDDLEETTSFLLVAATLLDLKAARLLPQGDVEDEEDLALLEARDLLFARLLQYKAFKQVAGVTSLTVTQLDGTARGGAVVAATERSGLPVRYIGIGEGPDDLQYFDPRGFARALVGLDP